MALPSELDAEVAEFRASTYADSTRKSYLSHRRKYMSFVNLLGVPPVPATSTTIARYAAFLARTMRPSSVRQYLNIIRLLHLESNYPNPLQDNWFVKTTLIGINRLLGVPAVRRTPVHPQLLLDISNLLHRDTIFDTMWWAAALVMFFGLLRKSNLLPDTLGGFDPRKQFTRSDFSLTEEKSVLINVKYSKTNQFHARSFKLKLLAFNHPLAPIPALLTAFAASPLSASAPAFVSSRDGSPMTGTQFTNRFKELVALSGRDPTTYASHSFRRGGASWALQCGVPGEIIQMLGDWKSDCYKQYLDSPPQHVHDHYRELCTKFLPSSPTPSPRLVC